MEKKKRRCKFSVRKNVSFIASPGDDDDDDFDDDGLLKNEVRQDYEGKYADLDYIADQISDDNDYDKIDDDDTEDDEEDDYDEEDY